MSALRPGSRAPSFALVDTEETPHALAPAPTCLFFYKLECPTSAVVLPVVSRLHHAYPGARFLGVAQDEADDTRAWSQRLGATFPQLVEPPPYATSEAYGLEFTPTTFLLDADGVVRETVEAWSRDGFNSLSHALADLLGAPHVEASAEGDGLPPRRLG